MKKLLASLAVGGVTTLALVAPAAAAHEGSVYEGQLWPLNNSGASGSTTVTVSDDGETMTVMVAADGLNLDGPHAMHIHGIVDGDEVSASTCPTAADDSAGGYPSFVGMTSHFYVDFTDKAPWFFAAERIIAGPPISMFSMTSPYAAPLATVSSNG